MIVLLQRCEGFMPIQSLYSLYAQLRLMNFIRRIGRDEIYIKYVHQLVNVGGVVTSVSLLQFLMVRPYRCIFNLRIMSRLRLH